MITLKKPSHDSSSGNELPRGNDKADGAPPDDTWDDLPMAENAESTRFASLEEALLPQGRKKQTQSRKWKQDNAGTNGREMRWIVDGSRAAKV